MRDEVLVGYADIAHALGCDVRQAAGWADPLGWDPLPLEAVQAPVLRAGADADRVQIRRSRLDAWRRRNLTDGTGEARIFRMPAIAARARLSVRAAWAAWEAPLCPLPAQREADGTIWAYASAIDDWVAARTWSYLAHRLLASKLVTAGKGAKAGRFRRRRRWPATVQAPAEVRSEAEPEAHAESPAARPAKRFRRAA